MQTLRAQPELIANNNSLAGLQAQMLAVKSDLQSASSITKSRTSRMAELNNQSAVINQRLDHIEEMITHVRHRLRFLKSGV